VALTRLAPGSWQGPVESGFGWHLVFVDTAIPGRVPAFEEVESEVKTAWLSEQKALAWQTAYKEMRARYVVLLPVPPEAAASDRPAAAPGPDAAAPGKVAASDPATGAKRTP
jgi:parvulin-like peptidyl-prolyl isomerase